MFERDPSKRSIPIDSDGVARLIGEFHSHLAVLPPIGGDRSGLKPEEWNEQTLREIRHAARDPDSGVVDVEAHIRGLVLYTEIPYDVVRNISILALGRIAQKLLLAKGAMAFRHGTFLKIESDPMAAAEVLGDTPPPESVVINVWPPGADLSQPPVRRVPVGLLGAA